MKKYSEKAEILLPANKIDAFQAVAKIRNEPGITGISVITVQKIKVRYDSRKITAETIATKAGGTITEN